MMVLLMKLFGLFALKSKKPCLSPLDRVADCSRGAYGDQSHSEVVVRPVAIEFDRQNQCGGTAKLKEPILRKNYDSLLEDYAGRGIKVSIAKSKKAKTLADCFSGNGPKTLWAVPRYGY
jgi:hypothetical protein